MDPIWIFLIGLFFMLAAILLTYFTGPPGPSPTGPNNYLNDPMNVTGADDYDDLNF